MQNTVETLQNQKSYFDSLPENTSNIFLSSVTSAVLAAFLTNPLEVIVVNSQTNKDYKWYKELTSPKKMAKIWFVGIRMRCLYYAIQAFPFFFIFEQLKVYLKCDHLDSED